MVAVKKRLKRSVDKGVEEKKKKRLLQLLEMQIGSPIAESSIEDPQKLTKATAS